MSIGCTWTPTGLIPGVEWIEDGKSGKARGEIQNCNSNVLVLSIVKYRPP